MRPSESHIPLSATALRDAFDRSFADAPSTATIHLDDFLAVRLGDNPYAIRVSEIAGVYHERRIVPLINRAEHFIGIAGFRGTMAPIYDLASLLGGAAAHAPRWLILARASSLVGLAFDLFERHARVARDCVNATSEDDALGRHVRGVVRIDTEESPSSELARPIIDISSVLDAIVKQAPLDHLSKER